MSVCYLNGVSKSQTIYNKHAILLLFFKICLASDISLHLAGTGYIVWWIYLYGYWVYSFSSASSLDLVEEPDFLFCHKQVQTWASTIHKHSRYSTSYFIVLIFISVRPKVRFRPVSAKKSSFGFGQKMADTFGRAETQSVRELSCVVIIVITR